MKVGLHKARQCFGDIFGRLPHSFSLPTPAISRHYHPIYRSQHDLCARFTCNPFLAAEHARYHEINSFFPAEHARYHKTNSLCPAEHARYHKINSFCPAEYARYRKTNSVCPAEHARHSCYSFKRVFRITYRCLLLPNQASQEYLAKLDY